MTEELQPQEAETPETQEAEDQAPAEGDKDWEAEAKKYKAIAERKSKQLEKVTSSLKDEEEPKKPNETSTDDVRLFAKLYAKGYEDNEIEMAQKIATLNNVSVEDALKDEYLQAVVNARKQKEISAKAQLGPSTSGSYQADKEPDNRDDHKKWYEAQIAKIK